MTDPLDSAATVPACYVREVLARLRLPADVRARVLAEAGIPASVRDRPGLRCTPGQFERVYRGALRAGGDEAFGYLSRAVPRGASAFVLRAMTRCADLATCLEEHRTFYALFEPAGGWVLEERGGQATVRLLTATRAQATSVFYVHTALLAGWRAAGWLAGRALPLDAVTMPARFARFAPETRYLFGVAPTVSEAATLRFSTSYLALPVVRTADELPQYRREAVRSVLMGPPADPIEERVRRHLAEARPFAGTSVEEVARRLAMSRPTLARHLQRLGTSFAALRDELRRDRAVDLLSRAGLTVAEVAERLGYSEASAFQRAFKTWTGVPPRRYVAARMRRRPTPGGG